MKLKSKINKYFFAAPLVFAICAAVGFYFGFWEPHQARKQIVEDLEPQIQALDAFKGEVRDHLGYLEYKILQAYTNENRTLYTVAVIERQVVADKLKSVTDPELERAAGKEQLLAQVEELQLYRNEIVGYIDNAGNAEQYAKAGQTFAAKVIPAYNSIIVTTDALIKHRRDKIQALRQWSEYSSLISLFSIVIALLVSLLLAALARRDFVKWVERPLRQILEALPLKNKILLPNNEFGQIGNSINLLHAELEEIEKVTDELSHGNKFVDVNRQILSEKTLFALQAIIQKMNDWQDERAVLYAERSRLEAGTIENNGQTGISSGGNGKDNGKESNPDSEEKFAEMEQIRAEQERLFAEKEQTLAEEKQRLEKELGAVRETVFEFQTRLQALENLRNRELRTLEDRFAVFETDPAGNIVHVNAGFERLTGYTSEELQKMNLTIFDTNPEEAEVSNDLWLTVQQGRVWQGAVAKSFKNGDEIAVALSVSPQRDESGKIERFIGTCLNATSALRQLQPVLTNNAPDGSGKEALVVALQDAKKDLETTRAQLEMILGEQAQLRKGLEEQQFVKFRLAQQQAALQELTRNTNLKQGAVSEALVSLTETAVYAIDEDRVGLWLFTENNVRARCLDLYDRQTMRHISGLELLEKDFIELFSILKSETTLAVADAVNAPQTKRLYEAYLKNNKVIGVLSAPIRLGGQVVGFIMVEHIGIAPREWAYDEQNFVIAVSDVVSLALEQGNRKAMEEELRVTLEESQALDEELRQNAEEIEATNEEMRRTQIELRGQISALNNAAIVAETNLRGRIIYANTEFMKIYKYGKKEILGQSHSILKAEFHDEAFYNKLWQTINDGKVWKGDFQNKAKDGAIVWVFTTITPVLGLEGKPFKFISVSFDITEQKLQAEQIKTALQVALEQEETLRSNTHELVLTNDEMRRTQLELAGQIKALNNASMVYETDMQGKITYVNDALLAISHYQASDLIGKHYSMLRSGRHPEIIYQDQWHTVSMGKVWRGELELKSKTDVYFWAMCICTPVIDENSDPIKVINVLVDITIQKRQEFRLKKQQAALLELTSHPSVKEGNVAEAFRVITKIGVETLQVVRGSVWMDEEGGKVRCTTVVQLVEQHVHGEGAVLDKEMYPVYFRTIDRERIIAANDAVNDSRTKELAFSLLKPSRIVSVLDAAIRMGSNTVGLISFEQTESVREWTVDEQSFVASLADTISLVLEQKERLLADKLKQAYMQLEGANLEVMRQKEQLEEFSESVTQGIRYAKRIQTNILPSKEIMEKNLGAQNFFIVHRQRDQVGGDFYWFTAIDDLRVIVVADGTGHGVPGAFLTLIGYLLLNQIVNEKKITTPGDILYHLHLGVRTALKQDDEDGKSKSRDGMDMAVCTLNVATYEAQFAGANLPFYYYQDWEIVEIKPTKKSIGGEQLEEERIFQNHIVQLKTGDAFYMYTDGFVDQFGGPDNKRFSTRRFRDLILRTQHESMATQRALLNLEWKEWKEDRDQIDDVTVFGYKV